jgi:hypothetical protein
MAVAKDPNKKTPANDYEAQENAIIQIDKIAVERLLVPIVGTAPLLVHRFSEKAKRQMLDTMQGRKSPKEPKNPEAEYQAAYYRMKDGERFGFPAIAFKSATIGGGRFYSGVTMTALKQAMFFTGEPGADGRPLVEIHGESWSQEDVVRVGRGTDLRYRPVFAEWTTELDVLYVKSMLTRNSLLSLIDAGGMGVGVGEWRPEKDGDLGTYQIDTTREVKVISA